MAALADRTEFNRDILAQLRQMVGHAADLQQMVHYVQDELGFSREFIVPVIGYFCQAFRLPLREMLPLREWWESGAPHGDVDRGLLEKISRVASGADAEITKSNT